MKFDKKKHGKKSKATGWKNLIESGKCSNRKEARKVMKKGKNLWNAPTSMDATKSPKTDAKSDDKRKKVPKIFKAKSKMVVTKPNNVQRKVSSKENVEGISFSNKSQADRMKQLQAFVERNSNISVSVPRPKSEKKVEPPPKKGTLIKDKQKLGQLIQDKGDDEKEIKKIEKLLTKSKRKFRIHGFDEDFGSLLDDIEDGTMHNSEDYSEAPIPQEEKDDEVNTMLKNIVKEEDMKKSITEIKKRKQNSPIGASKKLRVETPENKSSVQNENTEKKKRITFSNCLNVREFCKSAAVNEIHEDQDYDLEEEVSDNNDDVHEELSDDEVDGKFSDAEFSDDDMDSEMSDGDLCSNSFDEMETELLEEDSDAELIDEDELESEEMEESMDTENEPNGSNDGMTDSEAENSDDGDIKEDIYGRLKDKDGNTVMEDAYVPPAMRRKLKSMANNESQDCSDLRRKITSLFTKLTDQSMELALKQLEILYSKNSRNDMNEIICNVTSDILVRPTIPNETCVQDFAFLISTLSANCGSEIGNHILTDFVERFLSKMDELNENPEEQSQSKEPDCILSFISQLFNFKVVASNLIFDILMKLSDKLGAKEVDLILLVLRSVGFTLRKMNPSGLKTLILQIQQKVSSFTEEHKKAIPRMNFMLECLKAIKNNNTSKLPDYNIDHVEKLRSMSKALVKRGGLHAEVNVSLADIVKSQDLGRWWLVGSAWKGNDGDTEKSLSLPETEAPEIQDPQLQAFMETAKKLKLSRPPLVNIFYILTEGSIDATDAAQKLIDLKLGKTEVAQIFNVLVFCVQRASFYDEFYQEVAVQLICRDKKHKWLLKKTIWGKFGDIENAKSKHISHLAQFVGNLVATKVLDITIFKLLKLETPTAKLVKFFRPCILTIIFSSTGEKNIIDIVLPLWDDKTAKLRKLLLMFLKVSIAPSIDKDYQKKLALFMHILTKEPHQA